MYKNIYIKTVKKFFLTYIGCTRNRNKVISQWWKIMNINSQITALFAETLKVFPYDKNSTSMHPLTTQNWIPIFVFFRDFSCSIFCDSLPFQGLPVIRTKVTKTYITIHHIAVKKVVDFHCLNFQRIWGNIFSLKLVSFRQEARNVAGTKFPLFRNSTISWTARFLISFSADISLAVRCWFSLISSPNFLFSFRYKQFASDQCGADCHCFFVLVRLSS